MRKYGYVKWLACVSLIFALLSLVVKCDTLPVVAASTMTACVALTYSQKKSRSEEK